jgi:D-glycero-D-manno-heptose 1,7-bisphosphate phosphatase
VELAIRSLAQCGYKIVVVTNQSGIARGLLTEEALEKIHAEMRRQLAQHDVHVDAIYYCPYHPEGTVEEYAKDSDLRKPKPGMLLQAAKEFDLDLSQSWMIGDGARDIEAGQRAGCSTVRVRTRATHHATPGDESDEDVQADYTVRNLVDAARVILRSPQRAAQAAAGEAAKVMAAKAPPASAVGQPAPQEPAEPAREPGEPGTPTEILREILGHVRQMARARDIDEFSFTKLVGAILQVLALLALLIVLIKMLHDLTQEAILWALIAVVLQLMSLTLFMVRRPR